MTDLVTFGETMFRLSPPAGERILSTDHLELRSAGAESNVAIAAARLGTDTAWLSKLPDSMLGERVVTDVRSHGVDTRVVRSDSGRQGTYYIEQAGEPRGTNVVYDREQAAVTTATPDELDLEVLDGASVFFTTGITPALSDTLYDTTLDLLRRAERPAFDLNYRSKLWSEAEAKAAFDDLLPHVDLLFAPERDARSVLDIPGSPEEIADSLRSKYDCSTVVLTRGEEGALASTGEAVVEQPTIEADTVDPIGTGDAFVGGYLTRHLDGGSVSDSLAWGAAAAALKRTIAGDVALVSPEEVRTVLDAGVDAIDR